MRVNFLRKLNGNSESSPSTAIISAYNTRCNVEQ